MRLKEKFEKVHNELEDAIVLNAKGARLYADFQRQMKTRHELAVTACKYVVEEIEARASELNIKSPAWVKESRAVSTQKSSRMAGTSKSTMPLIGSTPQSGPVSPKVPGQLRGSRVKRRGRITNTVKL